MQYILVNAVAILLATFAGFGVSLVYARRRSSVAGRVALGALTLLGEGWLACILAGALILAPHRAGAWTMALGSAVVIWAGFVLPTVLVTSRARGAAMAPALGDCAAWLAVMLVQTVVLQLVGLHGPS